MAPIVLSAARIFPPIRFNDRRLVAMQFFRARHNRCHLVTVSDSAYTKFPGYAVMHVKMNGNTHRAAQSVWLTMAFLWAVEWR